MKFTYMGFSQQKLIEYNLDLIDAAILRYFIDFKDSGSMAIEIVGEEALYWVKYEALIAEAPILNIKSNDAMRRRFRKLVDAKVLVHYHKKAGGSYSFYGIGENYKYLISDHTDEKSEGCDSKVGGVRPESRKGATQKSEGCDSKVGTKDPSSKDPSSKDPSTKRLLLQKEKAQKESSSRSQELEINEDLKLIAKEHEKCGFGTIDFRTKELLEDLLEQYSTEWIINAFSICVEANKRTLKYAKGILENWRRDGGMKLGGNDHGANENGWSGKSGQESTGSIGKVDLSHLTKRSKELNTSDNNSEDDADIF